MCIIGFANGSVICVLIICKYLFQHINNGIDTVKKIVQERNIQGVYGPLIENFHCDEKFFTAVEVTAGNRWVIVCCPLTSNHNIVKKNTCSNNFIGGTELLAYLFGIPIFISIYAFFPSHHGIWLYM